MKETFTNVQGIEVAEVYTDEDGFICRFEDGSCADDTKRFYSVYTRNPLAAWVADFDSKEAAVRLGTQLSKEFDVPLDIRFEYREKVESMDEALHLLETQLMFDHFKSDPEMIKVMINHIKKVRDLPSPVQPLARYVVCRRDELKSLGSFEHVKDALLFVDNNPALESGIIHVIEKDTWQLVYERTEY